MTAVKLRQPPTACPTATNTTKKEGINTINNCKENFTKIIINKYLNVETTIVKTIVITMLTIAIIIITIKYLLE